MTEADIQSNIRLELSKHGKVFRMQSGMFYTDSGEKNQNRNTWNVRFTVCGSRFYGMA